MSVLCCRPLFSVFLPSSSSFSSLLPRLRLDRRLACARMDGGGGEGEQYRFGPYKIDPREVFYSTSLSYAMVNLRPLLPGTLLFSLSEMIVRTGVIVYIS